MRYWAMSNGYCMPTTTASIGELGARLNGDPRLVAEAEAALRVGVHWDTQVRPPHTHRVAQVFASALPVLYAKSTKSTDWEAFARLVLRAAYDATLAAAQCKHRRPVEAGGEGGNSDKRIAVYLTALGGGAFGNRIGWINDAIAESLERHRDAPLDVYLVHRGTKPKSVWKGLGKGFPRPTVERAEVERGHGGDGAGGAGAGAGAAGGGRRKGRRHK